MDIHSIATADEVRAGAVPIGVGCLCGPAPAYYTPETYALHLENILDHVLKYEKYRAVLIPRGNEVHPLFVKEKRQALLLRPGTPLMVFEISQSNIAEACQEYLMRRIASPLSAEMRRQETVSELRQLIRELRRG